jgi:regulator of replication initiation timing
MMMRLNRHTLILLFLLSSLISFSESGADSVSKVPITPDSIQMKKEAVEQTVMQPDSANGVTALDSSTPVKRISIWQVIKTTLLFFTSFLIGALLMYLFIKMRVYEILYEEKDKYINETNFSKEYSWLPLFAIIQFLKKRKDDLKKELDECISNSDKELNDTKEKIRSLIKRNEELILTNQELVNHLDEPGTKGNSFLNKDQENNIHEVVTKNAGNNLITLYFSIPENDGNFSTEKGMPYADDKKFYKIVFQETSDKGSLHYITGEFDLKAIDSIDYYLMPACEVENLSHRVNAGKVIQIEPGTVNKMYDKWVIVKKVKVKLV